MEKLTKQLWNLMDSSRGSMEVSHTLELISYVAFIAKESPDSFQTIVNSGHAKQLDMLIEAGKSLEDSHPKKMAVPSLQDQTVAYIQKPTLKANCQQPI